MTSGRKFIEKKIFNVGIHYIGWSFVWKEIWISISRFNIRKVLRWLKNSWECVLKAGIHIYKSPQKSKKNKNIYGCWDCLALSFLKTLRITAAQVPQGQGMRCWECLQIEREKVNIVRDQRAAPFFFSLTVYIHFFSVQEGEGIYGFLRKTLFELTRSHCHFELRTIVPAEGAAKTLRHIPCCPCHRQDPPHRFIHSRILLWRKKIMIKIYLELVDIEPKNGRLLLLIRLFWSYLYLYLIQNIVCMEHTILSLLEIFTPVTPDSYYYRSIESIQKILNKKKISIKMEDKRNKKWCIKDDWSFWLIIFRGGYLPWFSVFIQCCA